MRVAAAQRRGSASGGGVPAPRVAPGSVGTGGGLTDYVKVRTVGKGSFGEAVLVQHRVTGRECVLKRVRIEAPAGQSSEGPVSAAENALREVQVLRRLQHPHIVEFLGAFPDPRDSGGGTLCLLMAFCEGGDLQQHL
jgi:serine/threonine protein kinase